MEQRATSQGAPPRVPSPGLARCQGPRGPTGYKQPGAQGASGKRFLAPTTPLLGPQKRSGGVKHPPHDGAGVTAQAGSHQKNRREQSSLPAAGWASASCRGGGRGSGSRCSGDGAAPGGAGGEAGGSDTARSSLGETEPPASGSGAQGGPPARCLCPWGLESGAVRAAGPGVRRGCRRA